ncbi:DegT/DnrJ/EryC1/StrS family aminotransferase [Legionella geestiana]|uniref:DegT/DnrJ/EryC1/StrS family aminotransferase n=1 Tax=Legionella geestiana TaxID=45065 RepID=UPI0010923742|nr:DegT/DnrJ/EryC1/StrS family aminotransferase [Legionella geestiana]QDQ40010.1 DegT/DnrJ/EryC1/StrS family aminotransferase [Legionella geestiana]
MQQGRWPFHADEEISAVEQVLQRGKTNYWTGLECRKFETEYAEYTGAKYAVALMNGTVALEAALYALDIGPGDEVITTCRTFIASASCAVMRGATPVLADVDSDSQNITAETIAEKITPRTKAIIAVHLAGWPCDMDAILSLARPLGIRVIEDCAQAHGARYKGRQVGTFGDVAAFSFCQDKIITTGGEGGMITTSDRQIFEKIWSLKDHGKNHEKAHQEPVSGIYRWLHDSFGTNWRMTEMQAAIGRIQLQKLNQWVHIRQKYATILNRAFSRIPALRVTLPPEDIHHAYYKYYVFIRPELLQPGWDRNRIIQAVQAEGIQCMVGSCPTIHHEKAFAHAAVKIEGAFDNAVRLGETSLMFLVHPTLSEDYIHRTVHVLTTVMDEASYIHAGMPGSMESDRDLIAVHE